MEAWSYSDLMFLVTETNSEAGPLPYSLFQPRPFYDMILWEAGKLVYAAEESSSLGAGCGTGGTKPLMFKNAFAREAQQHGLSPEETRS